MLYNKGTVRTASWDTDRRTDLAVVQLLLSRAIIWKNSYFTVRLMSLAENQYRVSFYYVHYNFCYIPKIPLYNLLDLGKKFSFLSAIEPFESYIHIRSKHVSDKSYRVQ
jgi:hypothetical protein